MGEGRPFEWLFEIWDRGGLFMNQHARVELDANSVRNQIRNYLIDNFLLGSQEEVEDATPLMEAGILDSTGVAELIFFIEEEFDIPVADFETIAENFNSINNMTNFVLNKLS